jgi:hypothetical protein
MPEEESSQRKTTVSLIMVIIGGLIVFVATTLYNDIYKQPVISIKFEPLGIHNSTFTDRIQIKNEGRTSANNIRLNIETNSIIV